MVSIFTLIGCNIIDEGINEGNIFNSKENVIGFSALSSVMSLHDVSQDATLKAEHVTHLSTQTSLDDTFAVLSEIDELAPYLDLVTTFMGNGSNFNVDVQASDMDEYEHKMTIFMMNMEGETTSYDLYYNETFEQDDDEDDMDTDEFDSILEGIMIIEGVTYHLYGEREVEEGEEELELTAKLDDENYVTLKYEIENDGNEQETEFEYEMFVDNQLVKRIEIEFEQDAEETELELKFVRGTRESEYEFEVEIDGNTRYIEIEYKIVDDGVTIEEGEIEITIVYDPDTGETTVRYEIESAGERIVIDEDELNDDDDDDDEEDTDDEEDDDDDDDDNDQNLQA